MIYFRSIKRQFFFLMVSAIIAPSALAFSYIDAKIGSMYPVGTEELSIIMGANYGGYFDKVVFLSISTDYYTVDYTDTVGEKANLGPTAQGINQEVDANLLMFFGNIKIDVPYLIILGKVTPFVQFGLGYNLMINQFSGENQNKFETFGGFAMDFEIGSSMPLGEKTSLITIIGLNVSEVSKFSTNDKRLDESIDLNGFYLQAGVNFSLNS